MNRLLEIQIQRNLASRDSWDAFTPHRQKVTKHLIHGLNSSSVRLCVLGAGNCNDIDLGCLTTFFREIHLIDLDGHALRSGMAREKFTGYSECYLHEGVDVTGVFHLLDKWTPNNLPNDTELDECIEQARKPANLGTPLPFDVVASICLLSQLIDAAVLALGSDHPRLLDVILSIRTGHLRLITELIAQRGIGLLVTDIVSSDTVSNLGSIIEEEFANTVLRLINERNFFTGINPFAIVSSLQTDPNIAPRISRPQLVRPWRWRLGKRVFAVFAIKFQKI